MILVIDNFDSFVANLARYFCRLGATTRVLRADRVTDEWIDENRPQLIVLSPGPCAPHERDPVVGIIRRYQAMVPMLGICLGHQQLAFANGGAVCRAAHPVHGSSSEIFHDAQREFASMSEPFQAARYHSLVVDPAGLSTDWVVTAHTDDRTLMGIRHRQLPLYGWQFHPESILTEGGYRLLSGVLNDAGIACWDGRICDWEELSSTTRQTGVRNSSPLSTI